MSSLHIERLQTLHVSTRVVCELSMSTGSNYAVPGEDYEFHNVTLSSPFFNFTLPPRASQRFEVTVINDSIAELHRERIYFIVGTYVPGGRNHCCNFIFDIHDDEGKQQSSLCGMYSLTNK